MPEPSQVNARKQKNDRNVDEETRQRVMPQEHYIDHNDDNYYRCCPNERCQVPHSPNPTHSPPATNPWEAPEHDGLILIPSPVCDYPFEATPQNAGVPTELGSGDGELRTPALASPMATVRDLRTVQAPRTR